MISERLLRRWYPDERKNGTRLFYSWGRQHTNARQIALNGGAGPATKNPLRSFRGEVARVVGVDIERIVLGNEELDEAHVVDGTRLPFDDGTFDIAISDYVLEHVEFPEPFLKEVHRVLKPGGSFFFRTPNKYHYASLIAKWTPQWVHVRLANLVRGLSSDAPDPYPTFHRLNSRKELEKLAREIGFVQVDLRMIECEPSYLVFSPIPFMAGVLYERTVNRYECLSGLRANIFGRLAR